MRKFSGILLTLSLMLMLVGPLSKAEARAHIYLYSILQNSRTGETAVAMAYVNSGFSYAYILKYPKGAGASMWFGMVPVQPNAGDLANGFSATLPQLLPSAGPSTSFNVTINGTAGNGSATINDAQYDKIFYKNVF